MPAPRRRPATWSPAAAAAAAACWAVAGWVLAGVARRVSVRTGVSDQEALGPLPGDEFIAHPMVEWTRGVTVHAPPERVWPWLAQMGYGRGGWYTPQWVDLFANRWVFGVRHPFPASASRLLPEYQQVAVGDLICDGPNYASYFRVLRVDPRQGYVTGANGEAPAAGLLVVRVGRVEGEELVEVDVEGEEMLLAPRLTR